MLGKQKELGLEVFTDGELRRRNFMSDFMESVEGIDFGEGLPRSWKGQAQAAPATVTGVVVSKIRQVRRLTEHEVGFLRQHSPGPFKVTLPSANQFPAIT